MELCNTVSSYHVVIRTLLQALAKENRLYCLFHGIACKWVSEVRGSVRFGPGSEDTQPIPNPEPDPKAKGRTGPRTEPDPRSGPVRTGSEPQSGPDPGIPITDGVGEGSPVNWLTCGVELKGILCPCQVPFLGPLLEGPLPCPRFLESCGLDLVETIRWRVKAGFLGDDSRYPLALELVVDRGPCEEVTNVGLVGGESREGLVEE